jgi:hypothetical protein
LGCKRHRKKCPVIATSKLLVNYGAEKICNEKSRYKHTHAEKRKGLHYIVYVLHGYRMIFHQFICPCREICCGKALWKVKIQIAEYALSHPVPNNCSPCFLSFSINILFCCEKAINSDILRTCIPCAIVLHPLTESSMGIRVL